MNDAELLDAIPDTFSIGDVFKATPHVEGGRRMVFFEASNEGLDQQGEVIVAKALKDSSDYFLRYGNVDIDHISKIGPRLGISDYQAYEIGQPREVKQQGSRTFVKSEIYAGEGPMAERANQFWDGITKLVPAQRWYASVGGQWTNKAVEVDSSTGDRRAVIKGIRWNNIGMSKTPVNQHIAACAAIPVGAFSKCFAADGSFDVSKALTAGYGTDSATLSGGGALREQSLQGRPINYFDWRNRIAKALRNRDLKNPGAEDIARFSERSFGFSPGEAAEHTERFMRDLNTALKGRK